MHNTHSIKRTARGFQAVMSTLFTFALKISLIFHGGKNEGGNAVAPVLAKWNDLISQLWHKRYGNRRTADLGRLLMVIYSRSS